MLKRFIAAAMLVFVAAFGVLAPSSVHAQGVFEQACDGSDSVVCKQTSGGEAKVNGFVKNLINLLLYAIGIIAVIMIIIGGIKYTTSNGDSSQVTSAKNTILYAVIGLVVALLAFAIVNFVLAKF